VTGVLYVDSRAATRQFTQADLALFAALAQHISIALVNARLHFDSLEKVRLEQSLELAGAIQRDLMPRVPSDLADWDVHGWYGPAEGTAGDFYDFVRMRNERLAIVVGDVTGHGIGPALITATAQASLRSYLRLISDPGEVVTLLNQDLCERVEDGRFLTLLLVVLENGGNVEVLNGGHAPPLIWRTADGSFETIERGGPALGVIADETYLAQTPFALGSGDVLALYSDGLTEARDPDEHDHMFGEEGVRLVLEECGRRGDSAKDTALRLVESAMELTGGLREDDVTVVVVRRR
jgi:serine phosphatase RsbU (regulator of sigma subunit)